MIRESNRSLSPWRAETLAHTGADVRLPIEALEHLQQNLWVSEERV